MICKQCGGSVITVEGNAKCEYCGTVYDNSKLSPALKLSLIGTKTVNEVRLEKGLPPLSGGDTMLDFG